MRFAQARHRKLVTAGAFATEPRHDDRANLCQSCGALLVLGKVEKQWQLVHKQFSVP